MAKVSVIIPLYNSAIFLGKCFTALAQQTFKDFDVICVDDCSDDNSFAVAQSLADKFDIDLCIFKNENNMGPSKTRKRGIEVSKSEYIAFCDSDDWYEDTYLQKMIDSTENGKNDIVFCNYNTVYASGKIIGHNLVQGIIYANKNGIVANAVDSLCCILFRRSIFDQVEFPNLRNGEDMALIPVLISKANNFGFVNDRIYNYNCRADSQSNSVSKKVLESLLESFKYIEENLCNEYLDECEFLGIRNYIYGSLLVLFKTGYKPIEANEIIDSFEKKHPNWKKNKYLAGLPKYKKIYLLGAEKRSFLICRILSLIHKKIIK